MLVRFVRFVLFCFVSFRFVFVLFCFVLFGSFFLYIFYHRACAHPCPYRTCNLFFCLPVLYLSFVLFVLFVCLLLFCFVLFGLFFLSFTFEHALTLALTAPAPMVLLFFCLFCFASFVLYYVLALALSYLAASVYGSSFFGWVASFCFLFFASSFLFGLIFLPMYLLTWYWYTNIP